MPSRYHRCHGEPRTRSMPVQVKLMSDFSVRIQHSPTAARLQPEPGCISVGNWVHPLAVALRARPEMGAQSVLAGKESATYSTKGLALEQENLDPSAGAAIPGKLPGPAMSRTRGGASVVVGARESRAHGEGGAVDADTSEAAGGSHVCGASVR